MSSDSNNVELSNKESTNNNNETKITVSIEQPASQEKIDNSKYKKLFHTKAKMLKFEEVESVIGHGVGGVCPFAVNDGVKVYLDESLKRFDTVFPACGSSNSAIELNIPDLEKYSGSDGWVDVCKTCVQP